MEIKKSNQNHNQKNQPNMRKIILNFPEQFNRGLEAAKKLLLPQKFFPCPENLIICGMGGSALPPELLSGLKILKTTIHKSYGLPAQAGHNSLVVCISYSGNTEETISAFKEALKRNLPTIAITTGGKLAKIAEKNKIPVVIISPQLPQTPPRLALGIQFAALSQTLANLHILPNSFIKKINNLKKINSALLEKKSKSLAKKIGQRIPLIYTSEKLKGLGLVWKNNFNENSKTLAFSNYLPEMNHNEIVGFWKIKNKRLKNNFIVFILKDSKDHPEILKRMKITSHFLMNKEKVKTEIIEIKGKNDLEKIFNTAILGLWTSYWLAIEYKVDPFKIEIINQIKNKLKTN
jgi:glucose/mannose-6-phosphate isomerase